jgi:perosamine synthetase
LKKFIPVNKPVVTKSDAESVHKVLKSGWISSEGSNVKKFEDKFSEFIGHKYSVAVSSGTAALEIAVKSLNLKKNDEVIIPNFTIISNALAVIKIGLKIKLIDCDLENWNMNLEKVESAITPKTKAIIATHIYNFPFRVDLLRKICNKKNIFIIEDAAEALGQKIYKKNCGSFGDISTFSFYANKQITTGEGGMISTNNKKIYHKMLSLRNLSFGKKDRFNHDDIGWNYRMTNIQATLGISQLSRIKKIVKTRHAVGLQYYDKLKDNNNIYIPKPKELFAKNIYWVIGVVIMNKKIRLDAKKVMAKLKKLGIGTRPFFWPMHKQKILKNLKLQNSKDFTNSTYISKKGFYLPSSLSLTSSEINYICKKVNLILK